LAIVEKMAELRDGRFGVFDDPNNACPWWHDMSDPIEPSIAIAGVCWWLARKFDGDYRVVFGPSETSVEEWFGQPFYEWRSVCSSTNPADAILTAWEIILGIKDVANG
jgi:hypothetical protein